MRAEVVLRAEVTELIVAAWREDLVFRVCGGDAIGALITSMAQPAVPEVHPHSDGCVLSSNGAPEFEALKFKAGQSCLAPSQS